MRYELLDRKLGWDVSQPQPAPSGGEEKQAASLSAVLDALKRDPTLLVLLTGALSGAGIIGHQLIAPRIEQWQRRRRRRRIIDSLLDRVKEAQLAGRPAPQRIQRMAADALSR